MTSDDFFAKYNPQVLLRSTIDMAFLDGMHWFEFLLRDLVNVEAHCRNNSVILLHDCIPTDSYVARRDHGDKSHLAETSHSEWWAGDCWKAVAIIKQYRPDLEIHCFDAPPTGIIAITNLDPTSRVLKDRYFEATREFRETSSSENLESYIRSLQIRHTEDYRTAAAISSLFWI
jgi:hypothetical protein